VSNVTIATSGNTVTQQRQNLGRTRVTGLQTDVEYRVGAAWRITGGYLYNRARVTKNAANPALVGTFLPQVPTHRGTVQVSYTNPRYVNLALEVLAIGRQFDDDANTRTVQHAEPGLPKIRRGLRTASRAIGRGWTLLQRAEPVRSRVLRRHASDDHRIAPARGRRHPRAAERTIGAGD
jgi:outer membrane receptor protein involved in Fe transport